MAGVTRPRLVRWSKDGSVIKLAKHLEDPKAVAVIEAEFDLKIIFPDYDTYTEVQKFLIEYGVHQGLSDKGASDVGDPNSKIGSAKARWADWLVGKIKSERLNATGAADNKKFKLAITEEAKAVTLEGLVLKKAMSKIAGQAPFTEEDEAKLQEFFGIMAELAGKGKKAKNV
jgi:hypothetical protein